MLRLLLAAAVLLLPRPAAAAPVVPVEIVAVATNRWAYRPAEVRIRLGQTVSWTNRDPDDAHNVVVATLDYGGRYLGLNESDYLTFDRPGRYPVTCEPHPAMGMLVVVEAPVFLPLAAKGARTP
ncbi:MAG: cupredoxin domain-containing protein [Chloroflexi bacterium]|nr:cupredoxin domain-containing protein [Chloroflexota bacterium]